MRCIHCMKEIDQGATVCRFCNQPQNISQQSPDALPPGTELRGRFLVGKELGRGGFGITYIGYDQYLNRIVAIKEYYPQALAARLPGECRLFWRNDQLRIQGCENVKQEAQKMHKFGDLPVAVRVEDVFLENNSAYIAMDYVEGITLKEYLLKNGLLSPQTCIKLMLPVLDTMQQMHQEGIIHRDISPDNIMIQRDFTPRILDLGAAKDIQMESGNTILVARNGFSPKEQYQNGGAIGPWTDVYALCATMYYSLTGRVPPSAMDRNENEDDLPFPPGHPLPDALRDVLQDGMRMLVARRIPNIAELKQRLESVLQPSHQQSHPEDPVGQPKEPSENHKIPVLKAHGPSAPDEITPSGKVDSGAHPKPPEKSRGLLPAIFSLLGIGKTPKSDERLPTTVVVSQPEAFPRYEDPNATVCLYEEDEDGTVLADEEPLPTVTAYLIQNGTGIRVDITKCRFVLGRFTAKQASLDCMFEDASKRISRIHAAILFDGSSFYLQDVSVKNSTLLNDVRLQNGTMPEDGSVFPTAYPLFDGDVIQLAEEKLTFHTGGRL